MNKFGLIGFPLSHSFSKKYFTEKFESLGISEENQYELFEIDSISKLPEIIKANASDLVGLNVTIPYKEQVIPFLDELDEAAKEIGAVNVIKRVKGKLVGYNSDYYGFKSTLEKFLDGAKPKALILGTGGASKAVAKALKDLGIEYKYVSRTASETILGYEQLREVFSEYKLIINSSPLGMYPNIDKCPDLPYDLIDGSYFLYDLVYNPEETLFMKNGREKGAKAIHGLDMLIGQAEKAYEIWNS